MMLGLPPFVIPAKAGIHLPARKCLPDSHQRRGILPGRSPALTWIPAFAGMAVLVGLEFAGA